MKHIPISAESVPLAKQATHYPQVFAARVAGRLKRKLGDFFALKNFGVNLTRLMPGAASALCHHHSKQDEFIYVLQGSPSLILDQQTYILKPGDCYGFKAGTGLSHQLVNQSAEPVVYIEIGDRSEGDEVEYPNDDLKACQLADGGWAFTHKDGRPYE
jgi:uncharacterized cupin superfamily protein